MTSATVTRTGKRAPGDESVVKYLREASFPLESDTDLDPLIARIGDARVVLLGEASHGTSEYYQWRARLSRRLIQEHGFSFVAVEGDWPDCYHVNRHVKGLPESGDSARDVLHAFDRWPTWMWANWEIVAFIEWLRRRNDGLPDEQQAGFFGLDVYSLWDSLRGVLAYLEKVDPDAAYTARRAYRCFEQHGEPEDYARATAFSPASCEREVIQMLAELRVAAPEYAKVGRDAYFDAEQNALVVKNAETYYRAMVRGDADSWNARDGHMVETLERLLEHHGPEAKAIVWEHNTHIGDARATDMRYQGMVNVGQLVRERRGTSDVVAVGFGGYQGSVIAGAAWGAPMERMPVPAARAGTWEDLFHQAHEANRLLLLGDTSAPPEMARSRGHRAIGVVYNPHHERWGNYVPTVLPARYDAFLAFEHTTALHPLHIEPRPNDEPPDTFPWAT